MSEKLIQEKWIKEAVACASETVKSGKGGPFGAVVVKNGKVIGRGGNGVVALNDPTAHAEVSAIRDACKRQGHFSLEGCELYTTCEPCPMCLASILWARIEKVYYQSDRHDAARIGFDDEEFYKELAKPARDRKVQLVQVAGDDSREVMEAWYENEDRIEY